MPSKSASEDLYVNILAKHTDTSRKYPTLARLMLDHTPAHDYRSKISLLLLVISLGCVVLIQFLVPAPTHEFQRVLICGLELLFVLPYLGMLPDRTNFIVIRPAVAVLLVMWVTSSLASVALSAHWAAALVRQTEWFCHVVFAACIWHFLRSHRSVAPWVVGLVLFAGVTAVLLVLRSWIIMPVTSGMNWRTSLPLFENVEQFSQLLVLWLALATAGIVGHEVRPVALAGTILLMSVFWAAIVWSASGLAVLGALFVTLLIAIMVSRPARWRLAGATMVAASVGTLACVSIPVRRPDMGLSGLVGNFAGGSAGLFGGRAEAWAATWREFLSQPWFGHGPDAYSFFGFASAGTHPGNVVLQFLTDWGVLGAVAFLMILLMAAVAAWMVLREVRTDLVPERLVAFSAILVLSVFGLVGGTFYYAMSLMMLAACFAVALVPPAYASAAGPTRGGIFALRIGLLRTVGVAVTALFFVQATLLIVMIQPEAPSPTSGRAQFVRTFPSTTYNLDRWVDEWSETHPEAAAEWLHWAHEHSANSYFFRGWEARMLASRGDYLEARDHAVDALRTAPSGQRVAFTASMEPLIELGNAYSNQMLFGLEADSSDADQVLDD